MSEKETENKVKLLKPSLNIATNEKSILANGYKEISEFQRHFIPYAIIY